MADGRPTKLLGLITLAALALGLWWWLGQGDDEATSGTESASHRAAASEPAGSNLRPKAIRRSDVDPWQAPRAAVMGTVRDDQGQPIAGAQVCARLEDDDLAQTERHPPHCVTTREDGTYRIGDLLGAEHRLFASARGYLPARYQFRRGIQNRLSSDLDLTAGVTRDAVDFVLEPGGVELKGVIKDIAGGEIEGAWVSSRARWWGSGGAAFTRSDEEGRFSLWVQGPSTRVSAYAEGYAKASRSAAVPGTFLEVFLTPESVVVGKVVWAQTGKPVEGAKVSTGGWRGRGSVYSEDDGSFRLEGLDPGGYKITVSGEELIGLADQKVHVGLGQTSDPVVVEVHPAFSVRGTVMVDDGTPCSYGSVRLENKARTNEGTYRGGGEDDGSVLVEGLLPGTYEVTVSCSDHVPEQEYPDLVIADASLLDLTWKVHPGQSIRGRVLDANGDPVEGARVSARGKATKDPRAQRSNSWGERSEPDGSFALSGLLPGDYELTVRHDDLPTPDKPTEVELPAGQDLDDVTLTLPQHGNVEGIVRDEKDEVVAGVWVRLRGPRWGGGAQTNDEGRFIVEYVEIGEYRISAQRGWSDTMRAPGASDDDDAGERIDIEAGQTTEVELVVEAQNGRITGRVLGEGGEPIADAFVEAVRESDSAAASKGGNRQRARWGSWSQQPLLTDDEGRFTLTDLTEGATYSVYANRKGGGEAIAEHVPEGTEVELSIGQVGVLAGVVRIEGGGTPERFSIVARDRAAGLAQSDRFLKTDGQWELSNLQPGTYEVAVDAAEGNAKVEVELAEGAQQTDIELVLAPRITLTGTLVDSETGEPVPGLKVSVGGEAGGMRFRSDGKKDQEEVSDAEGRFAVDNAPTGKIRVMVMTPGFTDNEYGWTWITRRVSATPSVQDIGNIELIKRRTEPGEESGDLGFKVKESEPGTEPEDVRKIVAFVRPGGPAAAAGLKVGEEIVTVDGQDIRGTESYRYGKLTSVRPDTTIRLGVMSGEKLRSVSVTAGPPR